MLASPNSISFTSLGGFGSARVRVHLLQTMMVHSQTMVHLSSWFASRLIPPVCSSGCDLHSFSSVRRHLAACVRDAYSIAEAAPWLSPTQGAPLPPPFLWSTPPLGSSRNVRQVVTFSVRRHLAACVRDAYSSVEAAPWLSPT